MNIAIKEMQINEEIRDKEIRVITDDGEQLGIMSAKDALKEAEKRSLDLVKIAANAPPPAPQTVWMRLTRGQRRSAFLP